METGIAIALPSYCLFPHSVLASSNAYLPSRVNQHERSGNPPDQSSISNISQWFLAHAVALSACKCSMSYRYYLPSSQSRCQILMAV